MAVPMRMAHSSHGAGNAPTAMAIAAGDFAACGIDLTMVDAGNTSDALALVMDRRADVAVAAGGPVLAAAMAGGDPLVVMSIEGRNIFAIMGATSVRSPDDLRGGAVAVTGPIDQDTIVMTRALREWGLEPGRDVTLTRVADRGAAWDAIVAGDALAMAATAPQPVLARARGLPVLRDFSLDDERYQLGSIVTTRALAEQDPDLVRAFLGAQLAGVRRFREDFAAALGPLRACSKVGDEAVLRRTHAIFSDALADYVPAPAALAAVARDLAAVTGSTVELDVGRLVDPSFAASL